MVEQTAVNRSVPGSSPGRGAILLSHQNLLVDGMAFSSPSLASDHPT